MIKSEIVLDSLNVETGDRLTTWLLTYPRFIHSELMTHRDFSRNAASSRAIPISKMIAQVRDGIKVLSAAMLIAPEGATTPDALAVCPLAIPVEWGCNNPGMQSQSLLSPKARVNAVYDWLNAAESMCDYAELLNRSGAHKQIVNRVLEPFAHITVVVTATRLQNFFAQRAHPDAQPEFRTLAYQMLDLYNRADKLVLAHPSQVYWHLPFCDNLPDDLPLETKIKVSTARCARTSFTSFDDTGKMVSHDVDKDVVLHDRLSGGGHMSPFEHPAAAVGKSYLPRTDTGNFHSGWVQYRKMLPGEIKKDDRVVDQFKKLYNR